MWSILTFRIQWILKVLPYFAIHFSWMLISPSCTKSPQNQWALGGPGILWNETNWRRRRRAILKSPGVTIMISMEMRIWESPIVNVLRAQESRIETWHAFMMGGILTVKRSTHNLTEKGDFVFGLVLHFGCSNCGRLTGGKYHTHLNYLGHTTLGASVSPSNKTQSQKWDTVRTTASVCTRVHFRDLAPLYECRNVINKFSLQHCHLARNDICSTRFQSSIVSK